jgi:hypothetical protein
VARAGQHARPTHKHCKPCANHVHAPLSRACTGLHDFHLVEFSRAKVGALLEGPHPCQIDHRRLQQGLQPLFLISGTTTQQIQK